MFVLKPENNPGRFVTNLRTTICVLKNSCKFVPKTAYKRPITASTIKRVPSVKSIQELEMELEMESEENFIVLDEPVSLFDA